MITFKQFIAEEIEQLEHVFQLEMMLKLLGKEGFRAMFLAKLGMISVSSPPNIKVSIYMQDDGDWACNVFHGATKTGSFEHKSPSELVAIIRDAIKQSSDRQ
jgi:hypothetical protein